jgi:photosystem II stability/assembly factor-like uncharacterized protein
MSKIRIILIMFLFIGLSYSQWIHTSAPPYPVTSLTASGNYVFEGVYGGSVYRSTNNGDTWSYLASLGSGSGNALVSSYGNIVLAGFQSGGLYLSTDNGDTWARIDAGIPSGPNIKKIYMSANSILVYKEPQYPFGGGFFISTNNGSSWIIFQHEITAITAEMNTICAATYPPSIIKSTNGGLNWSTINASLPGVISSLTFGENYILASLTSGGSYNGIYKSTNNGSGWELSNNGLPLKPYVTSLVKYGSYNFAGLDMDSGGVYMSSDNGESWVNTNLNSNAIYALARNNTYIFAGTYNYDGVWREQLPEITGIQITNNHVPDRFSLYQNYPNPFNPSTKISYDLTSNANVKLVVYDVLGRAVKTLVNGKQNAGNYEIVFDAVNLPSGVYFCKLITDSYSAVKKMIILK